MPNADAVADADATDDADAENGLRPAAARLDSDAELMPASEPARPARPVLRPGAKAAATLDGTVWHSADGRSNVYK